MTTTTGPALALRVAGYALREVARQLGHPDLDTTARAIRAELDATAYTHLSEQWAVHLLRMDALRDRLDTAPPDMPTQRVTALRAALDRLTAALYRAAIEADRDRQIHAIRDGRP